MPPFVCQIDHCLGIIYVVEDNGEEEEKVFSKDGENKNKVECPKNYVLFDGAKVMDNYRVERQSNELDCAIKKK